MSKIVLPNSKICALLVIDIQERLAPAMQPEELALVLRNTRILLETAREFGMPVLASEQYPKGLGPTLTEVAACLPDSCAPVAKLAFSCCREPAFASLLQGLDRPEIIVCGMETHVCVLQTVLDLLEQGWRVYVAADAVCSRTLLNRQVGLDVMREAGAVIGSTEMFVFGLLGEAGTERFKRIAKLVK